MCWVAILVQPFMIQQIRCDKQKFKNTLWSYFILQFSVPNRSLMQNVTLFLISYSAPLSVSLSLYSSPSFSSSSLLKSATWNLKFQEIDYTKEAANAELFASNFKNMDYMKVPSIFWEYTTPQV